MSKRVGDSGSRPIQRGVTRRGFLAQSGAAMGALALGGQSLRATGAQVERSVSQRWLERIGLQLYTVRREMQQSVERTLAHVAQIGYKEVEFAGYFGKTPREIRALLDANGLTAPSTHSADLTAIRTRWSQTLDDALTVGHRFVVCASLPNAERTLEAYRRVADLFNRAGEEARAVGVTLGYHNHAFEFEEFPDNTVPYDLLLARTDSRLVQMQLDLFWMVRGERDPLVYFANHPGRFFSVHVKDMDPSGAMVDVGAGRLPFDKYFAQAGTAGLQHYFVEHDNPANPMASVAASFRHLKALKY